MNLLECKEAITKENLSYNYTKMGEIFKASLANSQFSGDEKCELIEHTNQLGFYTLLFATLRDDIDLMHAIFAIPELTVEHQFTLLSGKHCDDMTPLATTLQRKKPNMTEILISKIRGFNIAQQGKLVSIALAAPTKWGYTQVVIDILSCFSLEEKIYFLNWHDPAYGKEDSVLIAAARYGHSEIVQEILQIKDLTKEQRAILLLRTNEQGDTALAMAIKYQHKEIYNILYDVYDQILPKMMYNIFKGKKNSKMLHLLIDSLPVDVKFDLAQSVVDEEDEGMALK